MNKAEFIKFYKEKREQRICVKGICNAPALFFSNKNRASGCRYLCAEHQYYLAELCNNYHLVNNPATYGQDITELVSKEIRLRWEFKNIFGIRTDFNHEEWVSRLKLTRYETAMECDICGTSYFQKLYDFIRRQKSFKTICKEYDDKSFLKCDSCDMFYPYQNLLITEKWQADKDEFEYQQTLDSESHITNLSIISSQQYIEETWEDEEY